MRILFYFIGWEGIVPWAAAVLWLTIERMKSQPNYGLLNAASDAVFAGAFALMFSFVVTVPLSVSLFLFLKLLPKLAGRSAVRALVWLLLIAVGGGWAVWLVRDGGFESLHLAAFVIRDVSDLVLADFSYLTFRSVMNPTGCPAQTV